MAVQLERFARDAKICDIHEGSEQVQKNTIASALLGKHKRLRQWPRQ